jgi:pilus assembly protein CpaC
MSTLPRRTGAAVIIIAVVGSLSVYAQTPQPAIRLLVGRSTIVEAGMPIARVSLTSAEIADVLVTTSSQLLLNGKLPGTTSMFVWDRGGAIRRYDVVVQRDVDRLAEQIKKLLPNEAIEVQNSGTKIVLSGRVSTKAAAENAVAVATGYVDKKDDVVSLLQQPDAGPSDQVLLRVRFAEVSRSAMTELGASFFTGPTGVNNTLGRVTTQQFPAPGFDELNYTKSSGNFGSNVTSASGKFTFSDFLNLFLFSEKFDLGVAIRALQTRGLFQSLAEPNLVAESGKEASFLAGGEFPVPVPQASNTGTSITIQFKEFGVRLNFTPTVVGNRIHLKVRPEVSTLDFNNAIVLQGFRIPALSTRRTETELELTDHQTFAIAGLINNSMISSVQKVPGLGDIPILGTFFKSKAAQKDQTELVVMITPEILPKSSNGVTPVLPRQMEPYLPPLLPQKSFDPPPPAFTVPAPSTGVAPASSKPAVHAAPALPPDDSPAETAATAAARLSSLRPNARRDWPINLDEKDSSQR